MTGEIVIIDGSVKSNAIVPLDEFEPLIELVVDSVTSEHSRRAYRKALVDFLTQWREDGKPQINKAYVQKHRTRMEKSGLAPSTINQRLCAIRKLVVEGADNGLISDKDANTLAG